jgi:HEAT repeat protein
MLLDESEVPNRSIGAGETLRALQWIDLYEDWNDGVRRLLSVINPNSARIYELIQALYDDSARARIKAADDLGILGELALPAVPLLQEALRADSNETVRAAAAEALGKILGNIGVTDEHVIGALLATMEKSRMYYDGQHAARALAKLGKPGMLALLKATRFEEYGVGSKAADTLVKIGQPVIAPLLEALNANLIDTPEATRILSSIRDPKAVPELIEALQHKNADIRAAAAQALGKIGDRASVPALMEAMRDQEESVRSEAASALKQLGPDISQ